MVSGQRGGAPLKFGKHVLKCAEQIDALHFTDAEEEMAVASVSRNLDSWEELRKRRRRTPTRSRRRARDAVAHDESALDENLKKMKTAAAGVENRAIGDRMIGDQVNEGFDW